MKRVSLQKSRRNQYVVLLASLLVATTPCANASTYCLRANELPLVSDPLVKGKIEERLRAIPVMKSHAVRQVDPRFAIAWQDEEECRPRGSLQIPPGVVSQIPPPARQDMMIVSLTLFPGQGLPRPL